MVNPFFFLYNIICPGRLQDSWALFLALCTQFSGVVFTGGHAHQTGQQHQQIQGFPKGKQKKGIGKVLFKSKIDPDQDPVHLEAVLYSYSRLCQQRHLMKSKHYPLEKISLLDEEIEGIENELFKLVPKDFIKKLEAGYY